MRCSPRWTATFESPVSPACTPRACGGGVYYELPRVGLGGEFRDAVRDAVNRIKVFPVDWWPLDETIRRCQIHRFPNDVIYSVLPTEIVVIAVAHLHGQPD